MGLSDDFTYGAPSLNNGIAQFKARGTENSLVGQWSRQFATSGDASRFLFI